MKRTKRQNREDILAAIEHDPNNQQVVENIRFLRNSYGRKFATPHIQRFAEQLASDNNEVSRGWIRRLLDKLTKG